MVSTIGRLQSDDFDRYWYLLTSVETFLKVKQVQTLLITCAPVVMMAHHNVMHQEKLAASLI